MKNRIITLLKAIAIVVAFLAIAIIIGLITQWSYYLHLSLIVCTVIGGVCYFYRTMRPKERYYFISYSHGEGFGCSFFSSKGIINAKGIGKEVSDKYFSGRNTVVILYYKEVSKEEYEAQKEGGKE